MLAVVDDEECSPSKSLSEASHPLPLDPRVLYTSLFHLLELPLEREYAISLCSAEKVLFLLLFSYSCANCFFIYKYVFPINKSMGHQLFILPFLICIHLIIQYCGPVLCTGAEDMIGHTLLCQWSGIL